MRWSQLAVLLVFCARAGWAAETASFLDVGIGARALSMGGAYTALADDAAAIYWNPAGLARAEKRQASVSHAELGNGTRHDFLAYAHPTSRIGYAAAITYLSHGSISGRDSQGRPTGGYDASDAAAAFGAGVRLELADLGVSVKYLRSHIASSEAQGVALDAGVRRELAVGSGKVLLGMALRNAGPGLKYVDQRNDLPLRAAFGAAYRFEKGHGLAAEFQNGPRGAGSEGGAGGEYKASESVSLRLGFTSKGSAANGTGLGAARGLTMGLGYRRGEYMLDYAAQVAGELGSTHRFTLSARW